MLGNLAGSHRKKTGVFFATISHFPAFARNLTEKPRGSLARSKEPDSPPTVENRTMSGDSFPSLLKVSARQRPLRSLVHFMAPWAPLPLVWTTTIRASSLGLVWVEHWNAIVVDKIVHWEGVFSIFFVGRHKCRSTVDLGNCFCRHAENRCRLGSNYFLKNFSGWILAGWKERNI